MLTRKPPLLWADDEEGDSAEDPLEEVWWDSDWSVEGVKEGDDEGPSKDESDGDGGSNVGVDSGVCVGEEAWLSSGAGVGTSKGVTDEAGGWIEGDGVGGADDVARVFISTFIPWLQCPTVPQMKYLLPGEESGMVVVPPL
jgi:hypothetical protein